MSQCDYCSEGLPRWHRREPDPEGLEGAQFIPCSKEPLTPDEILLVLDTLIAAHFSREEIMRVKDALT